jgi:hypothetical protein
MAELKLTALQQRFFLAILEGKTPVDAIRAARPPSAYKIADRTAQQQAQKMLKDSAITDALARARARIAERVELTVGDLVGQLMEARQIALAIDPPQVSAAVAATMGAGKLLGLVIDRSQVEHLRNKPSPVPTKQLELDETQWRRLFDPSFGTRNDR